LIEISNHEIYVSSSNFGDYAPLKIHDIIHINRDNNIIYIGSNFGDYAFLFKTLLFLKYDVHNSYFVR
jgi:hypothetical protein